MPPISVMIKPASSLCNLQCEYCFYHSLADARELPTHGLMSAETYRDIIKKALAFTDGKPVMISFQGGEPLLAGKAFFKDVLKITERENTKNSPIFFGLQTNGTLIDEEWCRIFKKGEFLIGLSLDGDRAANARRIDNDGKETFDKVMNAAYLMQERGVEFNILTVLTNKIAERIDEIYAFFHAKKFKHLQFIPCLKPFEQALNKGNENSAACLDEKHFEKFLFNGFASYLKDYKNGEFTSVRIFDNLVRLAHAEQAEQCGMNGHCCYQFVIEADGETYPCDFYCLDKYSMGSILQTDFFRLSKHPVAVSFLQESLGTAERCKNCGVYRLCYNGCKRERLSFDRCSAMKNFLPFALPHLKRMS